MFFDIYHFTVFSASNLSCIPSSSFVEDLLSARYFASGVGKHFPGFKYLRLCGPYTVWIASSPAAPLPPSTSFQIAIHRSYNDNLSACFALGYYLPIPPVLTEEWLEGTSFSKPLIWITYWSSWFLSLLSYSLWTTWHPHNSDHIT